jgi:hypothetical protein
VGAGGGSSNGSGTSVGAYSCSEIAPTICPLAETPITADIAASPRQHELKMLRHLQGPHRRKKPAEAGSFFSKISKVFINKTENLIKQSCQNKCASY